MYDLLGKLRVVEASAFVAGPSCTLHLAQLGAAVIRIDAIGGGPDFRRWPLAAPDGASLYWEGLNKGKQSIAIDLTSDEGRELALAIATADGADAGLFVTNHPLRGIFSHAALAARRADIISLRVMGWVDGAPGVDYTVNAAIGVPAMTGPTDTDAPTNHVLPAWDLLTGAYGAFLLTSALARRRATGEGAEIRLPLSDVAAAAMSHLGSVAEVIAHGDRARHGNELYGAFGRDFECADGRRLMVVAITPKQWRALIRVLGVGAAIAAVEAETGAAFDRDEGARYTHRARLYPPIAAAIALRDSVALGADFDAAGVTWGPYRTLHEAVTQDTRTFVGNPVFGTVTQPSGMTYPAAGSAATFQGEPRGRVRPAPALGRDSERVLAEVLGLAAGTIAGLVDRGIVAVAR